MNKYQDFYIADRLINDSTKPLVIAEIGINHNGQYDMAIAMADAAIEAGAEVIKHQTHIPEDEMSSEARSIKPGNSNQPIFDIIASCSLNEEEEYGLMEHVHKKGAIFISTPFSRAAAERLIKFDIPAFKIGSGECNNYPLLHLISKQKKPIILSTGMNSIKSIQKAVKIFNDNGAPYALLHCTNLYPTPYEYVRLGAIPQMQQAFPGINIGLSDHTLTNATCLGAVALGASILERHFTDHKERQGPDICCSMDTNELSDLISMSEQISLARGGVKEAHPEEQVTIDFAFASIVSTKRIKAGDVFNENNLWVKRPGKGGIAAEDYFSILGATAKVDIPADVQIKKHQITNKHTK